MPTLELPHTRGCFVCGRNNPAGLELSLRVDPSSGVVSVRFIPTRQHMGFETIVHGGILATVLDEAMVWAATWHYKRFCVCGEMQVRFRKGAEFDRELVVTAQVESARARVASTSAEVALDGEIIASASGKYFPLTQERNQEFLDTLLEERTTRAAATMLRAGDVGALGADD